MAIYTETAPNQVQEVGWLHWLFMRDDRAISCDVDVRGDGLYTVTVLPLWSAGDTITQTFTKPGDALRRHAEISSYLRASGWLLADRGAVGTDVA